MDNSTDNYTDIIVSLLSNVDNWTEFFNSSNATTAESDNLLNRFLWSVHSFYLVMGLLLNGTLLITIHRHTPNTFQRYSIFLKVAATGEIIGSIGNFSSMQRIIPCGKSLLYVSYGPCKYLGSNFCYAAYALTLFTYVLSFYLNFAAFFVRHKIVRQQNQKIQMKEVLKYLLPCFIIPLIFLVCFLFSKSDDDEMRAIMARVYPHYHRDGLVITGNAYLITISMIPVMVIVTVFLAPLYGVMIWERKRILRTVNKSSASMSSRTKHMHTLLIQMLSLQAVMPGILVLAVITFILGQVRLINHPWLEASGILLGGTPTLFSSIIVIAHVRPYREGLREDLKIIYFFISPKCLQRARQNEEAQFEESTVVSARVSRIYGTAV